MTVYLVSVSQPDYDCGSACTSILNNKAYKTKRLAYEAMIANMLKEMGLESLDDLPSTDEWSKMTPEDHEKYDKIRNYGISSYGIPKDEYDYTHKTCAGYINTDCDGEITYDIQGIEVED